MNIDSTSQAYLKGVSDGFDEGVEDNTYTDDQDRCNYRAGYDFGVAEYCRAFHPEDEE
jgi:hypothetical protein